MHDDRGVRWDGPGMIGDQERTSVRRDLLETLPLGTEPLRIDRVVHAPDDAAHVFRATPLVDVGEPRILWRIN